jgi:hypothetical protein
MRTLEDEACKTHNNQEELNNNIRPGISRISGDELQRVTTNVFRRYTE